MNQNDIIAAIEYLKPVSEHPTMTGNYCKHLKVAISALEKQGYGWDINPEGIMVCPNCEVKYTNKDKIERLLNISKDKPFNIRSANGLEWFANPFVYDGKTIKDKHGDEIPNELLIKLLKYKFMVSEVE